jgi:hypothetical protein
VVEVEVVVRRAEREILTWENVTTEISKAVAASVKVFMHIGLDSIDKNKN